MWASPRLDGQKTIWLTQARHMPPNYSFTWILTGHPSKDTVEALQNNQRIKQGAKIAQNGLRRATSGGLQLPSYQGARGKLVK